MSWRWEQDRAFWHHGNNQGKTRIPRSFDQHWNGFDWWNWAGEAGTFWDCASKHSTEAGLAIKPLFLEMSWCANNLFWLLPQVIVHQLGHVLGVPHLPAPGVMSPFSLDWPRHQDLLPSDTEVNMVRDILGRWTCIYIYISFWLPRRNMRTSISGEGGFRKSFVRVLASNIFLFGISSIKQCTLVKWENV